MEGKARLLVIDGSNLFHRSYHALLKQALANNEQPTFAVYGTINTIASICRFELPTHVVVVFDWGKSAYRLAIWPKYKAGRPTSNIVDYEDSENQMTVAQDLISKFGMQVWREKDVEADDIIATVVERFKSEVDDVVIVTGDKDLRQLVDSNVVVAHPSLGAKVESRWDQERVVDHYGVAPYRLPEIWALCGDKVDNIPGVSGIGEKTAIKLIEKYGDLSRVSLSSEKKIEGYRHDITMSEKLVQLNPSLSLFNLDLDHISFSPVGPIDGASKILLTSLNALGFDSLISRWSNGSLWAERGVRLRDLKSRK